MSVFFFDRWCRKYRISLFDSLCCLVLVSVCLMFVMIVLIGMLCLVCVCGLKNSLVWMMLLVSVCL